MTKRSANAFLPVLVAAAVVSLGGLARSTETTVAALASDTHFHGIAVDLADSSRIYLATHHGLYAVTTEGKARRISEVRDYMGFTAHPTDARTLFASGHPPGGGNLGFIVSHDGGRTWTKLSDGIGGPVDFHQMDVSKADPQTVYGVYETLQRSRDGGRTWEEVGPAPAGIIALAASSRNAETLYAATQPGLMRSKDGGRTWSRAHDGTATMVHVTHDGIVYAYVIGTGLVRAAEGDLAWQAVGRGLGSEVLLHLAVDPRDAKRLYAVAFDRRTRTQRVIASRDGGERWAALGAQ